jgi:hypothetical protein
MENRSGISEFPEFLDKSSVSLEIHLAHWKTTLCHKTGATGFVNPVPPVLSSSEPLSKRCLSKQLDDNLRWVSMQHNHKAPALHKH